MARLGQHPKRLPRRGGSESNAMPIYFLFCIKTTVYLKTKLNNPSNYTGTAELAGPFMRRSMQNASLDWNSLWIIKQPEWDATRCKEKRRRIKARPTHFPMKCHGMMKKILSGRRLDLCKNIHKIYGIPNNQTCYSISILRVFVLGHLNWETHNMSNQIKLL